ncbi:MAG: non-hydrolyzing UDP-N-acetylglucosamine 2-epimerase [Candidatus Limnocylindrales bacterium]
MLQAEQRRLQLACVVGTRPQIIKAAAAWPALHLRYHVTLIDTGQHYDEELAGHFFGELRLPPPAHQLGVGSGSPTRQIAAMLDRLEPILLDAHPDAVVVFGDTNSTLAGALAAAKLELPLVHVEAGLRSFDRRMPEEQNRVVTDHLADLLCAPDEMAAANLRAEGIGGDRQPAEAHAKGRAARVAVVGDLMQDLCAATLDGVRNPDMVGSGAPEPVAALGLVSGEYLFATVHRAENRTPEALREWLALLGGLDWPVVLALHPGTHRALDECDCLVPPNVRVVPPQGYRTSLALQLHAAAVVTDSGGVQREAAWLGTPALVLRETTEWPGTLEEAGGRSALVGRDAARAVAALARLAPAASARVEAAVRARSARVPASGAAEAMARALGGWLAGGALPGR